MTATRTKNAAKSHPRGQSGFSLLEVLIALVLLSVGLLGLAALQTNSLRSNTNALMRSQATILSYSILDRIRANRNNASAYAVTLNANPSDSSPAAEDVAEWKKELRNKLPAGKGAISTNGNCASPKNCLVTVTVAWTDKGDPLEHPRAKQNPNNDRGTDQKLTVQTRL